MTDPFDHAVTEALRAWQVQLASGISSGEALELAGGVCRSAAQQCFIKASKLTLEGQGIKSVMDAFAPIMSEAERATIEAGWLSGRIESALDAVIVQRELWYQSRKRILSKLLLPAGVLFLAAFVAPLPSFVISGDVTMYLFMALGPLCVFGGALTALGIYFNQRALLRVTDANGQPLPPTFMDQRLLKIPICAYIEIQRSLGEFSALMSNLLGAGIPIRQGLDICSRSLRNGCYRESIMRLSKVVNRGDPLSDALKAETGNFWPREFKAAVAVGEQSGSLDASLNRQAMLARKNYTRSIEAFAEWLPKVIYGCVALFIIFNIFKMAMMYATMLDGLMPK